MDTVHICESYYSNCKPMLREFRVVHVFDSDLQYRHLGIGRGVAL